MKEREVLLSGTQAIDALWALVSHAMRSANSPDAIVEIHALIRYEDLRQLFVRLDQLAGLARDQHDQAQRLAAGQIPGPSAPSLPFPEWCDR